MKRPRIYGSEAKCRGAVARYLQGAEELLDQAVGVRNQMAALTEDHASLAALSIETEWEKDVRRWFSVGRRGMKRYLHQQLEDMIPVLALGLPPDTGKPRHRIALDNGVPWLKKAREELQELQA